MTRALKDVLMRKSREKKHQQFLQLTATSQNNWHGNLTLLIHRNFSCEIPLHPALRGISQEKFIRLSEFLYCKIPEPNKVRVSKLTTLVVSSYKDNKCVFLATHPMLNAEKFAPIVESLSFNTDFHAK